MANNLKILCPLALLLPPPQRSRGVIALKKCFDAFRNATDAQRTFREIMYLQELSGHDNLIRMQHVIKAENDKDIYLTFDFMVRVVRGGLMGGILNKFTNSNPSNILSWERKPTFMP